MLKTDKSLRPGVRIAGFLIAIGCIVHPQLSLADPVQPSSEAYLPSEVQISQRLEINLRQRRVTLLEGDRVIKSYPIAIGRPGWETPMGTFKVEQMFRNPPWANPFTGAVIPGGDPANPLGRYWIGFWTNGKNWVGMHGTPNPESVGQATSHGCIRMYNRDIEELFTKVIPGTPVIVK